MFGEGADGEQRGPFVLALNGDRKPVLRERVEVRVDERPITDVPSAKIFAAATPLAALHRVAERTVGGGGVGILELADRDAESFRTPFVNRLFRCDRRR